MKGYFKLFEIRICEVIGFIKGLIITILAMFSIMGVLIMYTNPKAAMKMVQKLLYPKKEGEDTK